MIRFGMPMPAIASGWGRAVVACAVGMSWGLGAPSKAFAQSAVLLEAVRLHKADARALADTERAACEKASCPKLPELTLLAGYLALSEGDAGGARALLEGAKAPAELAPWHGFYLGQARFYTRDYDGAQAAFAQVRKVAPPSLAERAKARQGESLLEAGKAKAALPLIEAATKAQTPELLHLRARAREAAGKGAQAKADRILLALRHPAHPLGEEAWATLQAQKPSFTPTADQTLQRIRALQEGGKAKAAVDALAAVATQKAFSTPSLKPQVALLRAQALYAVGDEKSAEAAIDEALKGPRALAAQAAMTRARRALRQGDRHKAKVLMKAVAEDFAAERPAEDALFLAGWIALQENEPDDAVATFERFLERFPKVRRVDEVRWYLALAQLRAERYAQAQSALDGLVAAHPQSSLVPQARYWSTRAAQLGGKAKGADLASRYEQVTKAHGATFYGFMSRVRLGELGARPQTPALGGRPTPLEGEIPKALALAQRLTQVGLFKDAHAEVQTRLGAVRGAQNALEYGHALANIGAYGHAFTLGVRHLWGRAYTQKEPSAVALLYPLAWRRTVEAEAKAQGVPPHLVWAIMRRESAFKPEVASPADARGLMQIIPPTARAIAKELGEAAPPPDALFAPEVNIRYGTWYLGRLQERFGHPALIAAAYNAGPPAVLNWVKDGGALPLDLFVELIPYKETRGYVKQVVADYWLYQALYEDEQARQEIPLTLPPPLAEGVAF